MPCESKKGGGSSHFLADEIENLVLHAQTKITKPKMGQWVSIIVARTLISCRRVFRRPRAAVLSRIYSNNKAQPVRCQTAAIFHCFTGADGRATVKVARAAASYTFLARCLPAAAGWVLMICFSAPRARVCGGDFFSLSVCCERARIARPDFAAAAGKYG